MIFAPNNLSEFSCGWFTILQLEKKEEIEAAEEEEEEAEKKKKEIRKGNNESEKILLVSKLFRKKSKIKKTFFIHPRNLDLACIKSCV